VSNSYSNSGTLRATLVTNPVMIHEDENDIIAITASEIYIRNSGMQTIDGNNARRNMVDSEK
jgi:hypothetical protein